MNHSAAHHGHSRLHLVPSFNAFKSRERRSKPSYQPLHYTRAHAGGRERRHLIVSMTRLASIAIQLRAFECDDSKIQLAMAHTHGMRGDSDIPHTIDGARVSPSSIYTPYGRLIGTLTSENSALAHTSMCALAFIMWTRKGEYIELTDFPTHSASIVVDGKSCSQLCEADNNGRAHARSGACPFHPINFLLTSSIVVCCAFSPTDERANMATWSSLGRAALIRRAFSSGGERPLVAGSWHA